jgi:YVTN family beta-propeller protein
VVASPPAAGWTLSPNQFTTSSISVGSAPAAVAVDAGTHMVYVAGADGTMSVIDTTTRLVVRTVPLYGAADHIAVDASTHLVYVATLSTVAGPSHGYSVFDGTTSELLYAQFLPGVAEDSLAIDSAGHRVFLAPSGTGNQDALVQWFDTVTNHPAGVLASNVWSASGVAFDALTQRVFVVNDVAAGSVDMFTLGSPINHPVTVGVGASPSAIAFDSVTRKLFVTNRASRSVSVIDATANKVTAIIAVGRSPSSVAVDPSTHLVYVGDSVDNTVTVIDGITSAVVGTVGVGQGPDSIAVDTSTHAIWISTSGDDAVTVLDPIAVRLFGADRFGTAVAISAAEFSDNNARTSTPMHWSALHWPRRGMHPCCSHRARRCPR